jgi:hypothetical protein
MIGAAIATSSCYLVSSILALIMFSKISNNRILDLIIIKRGDLVIYTKTINTIIKYIKKR